MNHWLGGHLPFLGGLLFALRLCSCGDFGGCSPYQVHC